MFRNIPIIVALLWVAVGLVNADAADAVQPPAADQQPLRPLNVVYDIVYASPNSQPLTCDIYSPANLPAGETVPAVLVIHGGAWSSGSKSLMGNYASRLAQLGMVAVVINYRHAPEHKFPAQVDDVRDALVWINEHAAEYLIDPDRIGVFGYSAGGHLACMIATLVDEPLDKVLTTSAWDAKQLQQKPLPKIAAVVAGGPPCEFRTLPPHNAGLAYWLGGTRAEYPATYEAASPIAFASQGDCPICFIHGERDIIVPIVSSKSLYEAQVAAGVKSEFVVIEKQGHLITFIHPKAQSAVGEYLSQKLALSAN